MFDSYEEIFARRADGYERAMAAFPAARDAEFEAVVDPLDPGLMTVFDMPAGAGYLHRYLPADKLYVAIEPANYFFERCPDRPGATRIQSAIEAVPSPLASADAIVTLAGLHHAPDLAATFAEFRRLLRPSGMLVIADVGAGTPPDRFLNVYVHGNSPMGHEGSFLDAATAPLLRGAGFDIASDEIVAVPWRFASAIEAGTYCADLFGIAGPDAAAVATALDEIVGTSADTDDYRVNWVLRRIVARAV